MLQAISINKTIHGREILKNVSLSFKVGEIISIIGPSGSGKTTLLKALSLIDPPESGSLVIDNASYRFPIQQPVTLQSPYPNITIVFQQLFLWPHLTLKENILLPLRGKYNRELLENFFQLFQAHPFLDRYPNEVSMGQRQRVALIRALMLKPKYLLLDEITSALDVEQAYLILTHLKKIAQNGTGILIVTHDLHFAQTISNKVIFLDNGSIIEEGSRDILFHPKTKRLKQFISKNF